MPKGRTQFCVSVPASIRRRMDERTKIQLRKRDKINWSESAVRAFLDEMARLDRQDEKETKHAG
jgi:hypothetical protein